MPQRKRTMNISMTPRLAKYVEDQVKSGRYGSTSEVFRTALRQMHDRETRLEWLRRQVARGIKDLDEGRTIPAEQVFERAREVIRRRRRKSA